MSAPEAMTYESLKEDIKVYAERENDQAFINQIDRFIMLAEQRLATEAKGLGFIRVAKGQLTPNNPILQKPQRWRQTREFSVRRATGEVQYLYPRTYGYCKVYSSVETATLPEYYSNYDFKHFYLACTPDLSYWFELSYYERPEPLSESNQTNWTTVNAPQLLLYASLLEAQPFLKNTTQLGVWQSQYAQMLASLARENAVVDHDNSEAQ